MHVTRDSILASIRSPLSVAALILGCASSGHQPATQDTAADNRVTVYDAPAALTLETGVDQAALSMDVTSDVIGFLSATVPDASFEPVQLGKPWGVFVLHKGPRLEFLGLWRMLASRGGEYFAVVGAMRRGDRYAMVSIGSAQFVPILSERETAPRINEALHRGRAGLLQIAGEGGPRLLAYEADTSADALEAEIRVQPLSVWDGLFQGIDAGWNGAAEASIWDVDKLLPSE